MGAWDLTFVLIVKMILAWSQMVRYTLTNDNNDGGIEARKIRGYRCDGWYVGDTLLLGK